MFEFFIGCVMHRGLKQMLLQTRDHDRYNQSSKKTDHLNSDSLNTPFADKVDRNAFQVPANRQVMFCIQGAKTLIDFYKTPVINLGRFDRYYGTSIAYTLDLTPYNAMELGVSRRHCRISLIHNQLVVSDLGSSNGTYVSGRRLMPNQPYTLKKDDELVVARLPIRIMALI